MSKKQMTRRALLTSVISLILCCAMLVGTTFAWFTDSVTSGKNQIVAGNLDIELEYSKDMATWTPVEGKEDLIDPRALWEPGHTEVVYLKVSNLGSLALNYQFSMSVVNTVIGQSVEGGEIALADYLKYAIIPVATPFADRNAARTEASKTAKDLAAYMDEDSMQPGADPIVMALVVYMPETVGNEANHVTGTPAPTIELGLNLYATQFTYESDSFGSDYDNGVIYPAASVSTLDIDTVNATYGMGGSEVVAMNPDVAFRFATTESADQGANSHYRYWHADFVVKADKDVAAESLALVGYYEYYCKDYNNNNWVAMVSDEAIPANTEIRLLETLLNGGSMSYQELCQYVPVFDCGAVDVDGSNKGTTLTVELRLYEVLENTPNVSEETGNYITVGTYTYTFGESDESGIPAGMPEAIVNTLPNEEITWSGFGGFPAADNAQQLAAIYEFKAPHDSSNVDSCAYKDWNCDYYVSVNRDIAAGQIFLGGNYGEFGWVGFENPDAVSANQEVPLLGSVVNGATITYKDVVTLVSTFKCGVAKSVNATQDLSGMKFNVMLRMTNPADASEHYDVATITYIFP